MDNWADFYPTQAETDEWEKTVNWREEIENLADHDKVSYTPVLTYESDNKLTPTELHLIGEFADFLGSPAKLERNGKVVIYQALTPNELKDVIRSNWANSEHRRRYNAAQEKLNENTANENKVDVFMPLDAEPPF